MKTILCLVMVLILSTSCAAQPATSPSSIASSSAPVASTSSAKKKIVPLPATLKIDSLTDATVAASFEPKDLVTASAGIHSLNLKVYDYEMFDLVDISTLAVGDTIVVSQKEIKVDALEKSDTGKIVINGGIENGGLELSTDENTVYFETGMDGFKSFYEVGQLPLNLSDDFKFVDNSDLDNPNQEFTYDEFANKLESKQISFTSLNTTVTILNETIVEIALSFNP